ncbi:glycosyl transferase, family 9 [Aliivibrio fischeri MJ11]|nr:glycosyl transferase, family 9 [Aliivibrio fischeri MJ11]
MSVLEPVLYAVLRNNRHRESNLLKKDMVKSILIIRNNKRIGNMYFLIPFVKQVRASYPDAHITLMLNQPWQRDVFSNMGIDKIVFSYFSMRKFYSFVHSMRMLRKKTYDLVVLPYSSVEDTMICSMLSAKNKVAGFNSRRNAVFTHTFKKDDERMHAALSCLYLLPFIGGKLNLPICHHLELTQQELKEGVAAKQNIYQGNKLCIAYFRGARGDKRLPDGEWLRIINKFENSLRGSIQWVEILSPDIAIPLKAGTLTFSTNDMRHLASVLKSMDCFICCDTGPLHLADAAGVNCIGLFNKTNPIVFGVLGNNSINVEDIVNFDVRGILSDIGLIHS